MTLIEIIQQIGNEVCEGCGEDSDCGIVPATCERIINALVLIEDYYADKLK